MWRLNLLCLFALLTHADIAVAETGADDSFQLDVHSEPGGGVRATATVRFPAAPRFVLSVLTDFAKWPELFTVQMRVADLHWRGDRAVTDLYIKHAFLPGERRLLCESRILPDGLETVLLAGDFTRYERMWRLTPDDGGARTRADFRLFVELETLVPDWMVALSLKRELERHFRLVADKAAARARQER